MTFDAILGSFLNPPILFFLLGGLAVLCRSDLQVPAPLPKFLALYLLMAIGFKGGVALNKSGLTMDIVIIMTAAVAVASVIPIAAFFLLRTRLDGANAAAIAATYGSVSAVTFITAVSHLEKMGIPYGGFMVAAMALMESPAIVMAVLLNRQFAAKGTPRQGDFRKALHEALTNGSVFLLVGSLAIGFASGGNGQSALKFFTEDLFKGMLAFFLLDMGILAANRLKDLRNCGWFLIGFAVLFPLAAGAVGIGVSYLLGLPAGDALLFTILCAGASYIAVPAAMRLAIPEANPSLYVPMALGLTFPFNIAVGIPLYLWIINRIGL